jgi:hypothetical protein
VSASIYAQALRTIFVLLVQTAELARLFTIPVSERYPEVQRGDSFPNALIQPLWFMASWPNNSKKNSPSATEAATHSIMVNSPQQWSVPKPLQKTLLQYRCLTKGISASETQSLTHSYLVSPRVWISARGRSSDLVFKNCLRVLGTDCCKLTPILSPNAQCLRTNYSIFFEESD